MGIKDASAKLEDAAWKKRVIDADIHAKRDLDIHGVPHFVIGNGETAIALHGAQSTNALAQALQSRVSQIAT